MVGVRDRVPESPWNLPLGSVTVRFLQTKLLPTDTTARTRTTEGVHTEGAGSWSSGFGSRALATGKVLRKEDGF